MASAYNDERISFQTKEMQFIEWFD